MPQDKNKNNQILEKVLNTVSTTNIELKKVSKDVDYLKKNSIAKKELTSINNKLAVLKDNSVTKKEFKEEISKLATKEELKKEVSKLATKEELQKEVKKLVTKKEFNDLTETANFIKDNALTREEFKEELDLKLSNYATKQELNDKITEAKNEIITKIDGFIVLRKNLETELSALQSKCNRLEAQVQKVTSYLNLQ